MDIKNTIRNIISNPQDFFFKNLGVKQTIAKNTFWLAVAEGITRFLKLFLIIYVARILGATEYGKFTFALAFISLFVIFSDLGVSQIATREFSRDKKKEKEFPAIFTLTILLSLGTLILILIGSFFVTPDPIIRKIIWILGMFVLIDGFSGTIYCFLRARQKMQYEAWPKILEAIVVTGAGFFVIFNFPSIQNLSLAYLFAGLVTLISVLFFFHFKIFRLRLAFETLIWKKFLTMSWPLAMIGIFGMIYGYIDSVMLGYLGQITQTGWYNAAYRIVNVTFIPAALISTSFYPVLSIAFKESKEKFQKIWDYRMEIMIFLAVPITVGGIILAQKIIDFVYDPSFTPAILVFQILIITAGITFLSSNFHQALLVSNQQKKIFWSVLVGAIINIILNLILIPKYSLYGAAFTTVVTCIFVSFLLFKFTSKFTSIKILNQKLILIFIGSLIACIPMCLVISQPKIYHLNIFIPILIGAGIYSFCFLLWRKLINRIFA